MTTRLREMSERIEATRKLAADAKIASKDCMEAALRTAAAAARVIREVESLWVELKREWESRNND